MTTAPARIGFTAFNRVCSIGRPVIYDTARVITHSSNSTESDQSGPTTFLCGIASANLKRAGFSMLRPAGRAGRVAWPAGRSRGRRHGCRPRAQSTEGCCAGRRGGGGSCAGRVAAARRRRPVLVQRRRAALGGGAASGWATGARGVRDVTSVLRSMEVFQSAWSALACPGSVCWPSKDAPAAAAAGASLRLRARGWGLFLRRHKLRERTCPLSRSRVVGGCERWVSRLDGHVRVARIVA